MKNTTEKIKKERKKGSGGARVNAGRKAKPENERRQQLAISCTFEQKAAIVAAAEKEGITTAAYVLRACGVDKL